MERSRKAGPALQHELSLCDHKTFRFCFPSPAAGKMSQSPVRNGSRHLPCSRGIVFQQNPGSGLIMDLAPALHQIQIRQKAVEQFQCQRMTFLLKGENQAIRFPDCLQKTKACCANSVRPGDFQSTFVIKLPIERGIFLTDRTALPRRTVTILPAVIQRRQILHPFELSSPVQIDRMILRIQFQCIRHVSGTQQKPPSVPILLNLHIQIPFRHPSMISSRFPVARLTVVSAPP